MLVLTHLSVCMSTCMYVNMYVFMYVCILHAVFNQVVVNLHTVNLDSITVRGVSSYNVARLRTVCILYLPSVPPSALPSAKGPPYVVGIICNGAIVLAGTTS